LRRSTKALFPSKSHPHKERFFSILWVRLTRRKRRGTPTTKNRRVIVAQKFEEKERAQKIKLKALFFSPFSSQRPQRRISHAAKDDEEKEVSLARAKDASSTKSETWRGRINDYYDASDAIVRFTRDGDDCVYRGRVGFKIHESAFKRRRRRQENERHWQSQRA
tara:strand:+ start:277 stop:768 length:492 start_codon:yes stop_codon:yes gene_type:complete